MTPKKSPKPKTEHEKLGAIGLRIEQSYLDALKEMTVADPRRPTVSTLIRLAVYEYLRRNGKIGETK
jgi:hypothetical protein